jgi:hypothetical protein
MRAAKLTLSVVGLCGVLLACTGEGGGATGASVADQIIAGAGTIHLLDACPLIRMDSGGSLEPTNLDPGFKQQGMRVRLIARIIPHLVTTCQVGLIVELLEIEPL